MKLKDLATNHDYYASSSNYYSNEAGNEWNTWSEFYQEFREADVDMNLVYRWDISLIDDSKGHVDGNYQMQVIIIGQRKGLYLPHTISRIFEIDLPEILLYLKPHFQKLISIWQPISGGFIEEGKELAREEVREAYAQWNDENH